ncbi:hypothetical protein J3E72DRAFT_389813 [Bipolaris maydis]|nr:hypothetical protein J3E72DRAFT_389813 [Bipolaris maydis]
MKISSMINSDTEPPSGMGSSIPKIPIPVPHVSGSMREKPVLCAIERKYGVNEAAQTSPMPLPSFGAYGAPPPRHSQFTNHSPCSTLDRQAFQAPQTPLPDQSVANKPLKWTQKDDDLIIRLRSERKKWSEIAKELPGRSSIGCRLRYQNYLEKPHVYGEEVRDKFARLYISHRLEMLQEIAAIMGIPAKAAEALHWELGEKGIEEHAKRPVPFASTQSVMPSQQQVRAERATKESSDKVIA